MTMDRTLNIGETARYSSNSQKARVITESWVQRNAYCPNCGFSHLTKFANNRPVADVYCSNCNEEFEIKSKISGILGHRIVDGAYSTMIARITSQNNPHFFFLTYDKRTWMVNNFMIVPKYFFIPEIIERRPPLRDTARRAGWIGCNINLSQIPQNGRIFLIRDDEVIPKEEVRQKWENTRFLKSENSGAKGWILDIMKCIDAIQHPEFTIQQVYSFEQQLRSKHPNNNHIRDKIRQQLQFLRDKGIIEFLARGKYRKVAYDNENIHNR